MAIILNIDTAINTASICLARDGDPVYTDFNNQKDQAAWLHQAVKAALGKTGIALPDLEALAVSIGPGSYTGLRIGLAAAKGMCYALKIPLITINTLQMMASSIIGEQAEFFCPLIDARRMEVFMAVYDKKMNVIMEPCARVIDRNDFESLANAGKTVFTGNGTGKLRMIFDHPNAVFIEGNAGAPEMAGMAEKKFTGNQFADVVYAEPFYIKEFYSAGNITKQY